MVNAFSELEDRVMDDDLRAGDMERIFKGQGRELYLTDKMSKIFDDFVLLKFFRFQDEMSNRSISWGSKRDAPGFIYKD